MKNLPSIALVGRMNVGKSSLFNRLSTTVKSLTLDYEGVTRDFIKDEVTWSGVTFELIDTGGITLVKVTDPIQKKVQEKVEKILSETDLILFVVDGKAGLLKEDKEIAANLRKLNKPVILVINKSDAKQTDENMPEFYKLGFKNNIPVSASHGLGITDLLEVIIQHLPKKVTKEVVEEPAYKVVFLGKPNVGKSSLMNAILKEERSIVSEVAGTTREPIAQRVKFYQEDIELVDTAGIRRKRSVSGEIEPLMVKSSFQALKDSDIVVCLIDGTEAKLADQELKLAFYSFQEQHKALILLVNKEDLMTDLNKAELANNFDYYKHLIKKIPVMFISCKTGKNIGKVLTLINEVWKRHSQKFSDSELTNLLVSNLLKKPFFHETKSFVLYSAEQVKTAPITIILTVNQPQFFEESHVAFFENIMRDNYDLIGVPVKFLLRKKS
ncbi:ribosome biogenesis GTPase Der [Candidatus Dependentiae bacterium]|nr:ribosome biogenesis GTPase Der [Candidatus Dependentiae bacterium]